MTQFEIGLGLDLFSRPSCRRDGLLKWHSAGNEQPV